MAIDSTKNSRENTTLRLDVLARVEEYRRRQTPIPSKSAALAALIEDGLDRHGIPKPKSPKK